MERRRELGEIGRGDEPRETMDSEKQSEGFEVWGDGRLGYQVVGIIEGMDCMELWVLCKK